MKRGGANHPLPGVTMSPRRGLRRRIYVAFLLVATIPTAAAGLIGIYYSLSALRSETLLHLRQEVDARAHGIAQYFQQLGTVLRYLAGAPLVHNLIASLDQGDDSLRQSAALLQRDWLTLAASYPHLLQIRFLDRAGHERVRVDHVDGELRVVPESELQDKSDRYYFAATMALPPGRFFVSRLDLNVEHDMIEQPERPVIRLATALTDSAGQRAGMLIVNLDARVVLDELDTMVGARPALAYLFDPDGFYLQRSEAPHDAGFPARPVARFAEFFGADTLANLRAGPADTWQSRGWILAHAPVPLLPEIGESAQGWTIALAYPERQLLLSVLNLYLLYAVLAVALLVTAVSGYLVSRRLLRPLERLARETEAITAGDMTRRVPVYGDDEIADLGGKFNAMVATLATLMQSVRQHNEQLEATVRQRTAELEHQRGRLSAIIEHTAEAIIATDETGGVLLANGAAQRLFEQTGSTSADASTLAGASWQTITAESKHWREVRLDVHCGDCVLAVSATRLRNPPPQPDDLILVIRDVSEERRLQDERRDLDRQLFQVDKLATLGELAMGVAHEIGNPLAGMKAVVQVIQCEPLSADMADAMQRLESEIDRLSGFLRSFHGFAAPSSLRIQPCLFASLLDDVLFWVAKDARSKGVAITCELDDALPLLAADPAQLKQVLLNLLVNALAAMPAGGVLLISSEIEAGPGFSAEQALIRIRDTGIGIPENLLTRVFEPFFTTRERGSGLGLAIIAKIVADHGARITLSSRVGEGTTVELRWPTLATEPINV